MQATKQPCVAMHRSRPESGSSAVVAHRAQVIIGRAEGLVALTVGCLALGTYVRRDLTGGAGIALSIGAVICVIGLNSASASGRTQLATTPLLGLGPPYGWRPARSSTPARTRIPLRCGHAAVGNGPFGAHASQIDAFAELAMFAEFTVRTLPRCWRVAQR